MTKRILVLLDGNPHRRVPITARLSDVARFDNISPVTRLTWDLAETKEAAKERLTRIRDERLNATVSYGNKDWRADREAVNALMNAVTRYSVIDVDMPPGYSWNDANGTPQPVPALAQLKILAGKVFDKVDILDKNYGIAIQEIDAAGSPTAVRNILKDF